jgi:hypothetical protein
VTAPQAGPAPEDVRELRDPYLFEDADGSVYLLFCGRGEDAIAIARVEPTEAGLPLPVSQH